MKKHEQQYEPKLSETRPYLVQKCKSLPKFNNIEKHLFLSSLFLSTAIRNPRPLAVTKMNNGCGQGSQAREIGRH